MYVDPYPLLEMRKFILLICTIISSICRFIIKHPYFENLVLILIIFNTVVLTTDDPTTNVSTPF